MPPTALHHTKSSLLLPPARPSTGDPIGQKQIGQSSAPTGVRLAPPAPLLWPPPAPLLLLLLLLLLLPLLPLPLRTEIGRAHV